MNECNQLRLKDGDARQLSAAVARTEATASNLAQRAESRSPLNSEYKVIVKVHQPGGTVSTQVATVRDISPGGMAMFWGSFLHAGTKCSLTIVHEQSRTPVSCVSGSVVRCNHVRGSVHDVGVKFDEKADVSKLTVQCSRSALSHELEPIVEDLLESVRCDKGNDALARLAQKISLAIDKARRTPPSRAA